MILEARELAIEFLLRSTDKLFLVVVIEHL